MASEEQIKELANLLRVISYWGDVIPLCRRVTCRWGGLTRRLGQQISMWCRATACWWPAVAAMNQLAAQWCRLAEPLGRLPTSRSEQAAVMPEVTDSRGRRYTTMSAVNGLSGGVISPWSHLTQRLSAVG